MPRRAARSSFSINAVKFLSFRRKFLSSRRMARNKEGLVLLLDVGPYMHNALPEVEKLCSLLVQKKFVFSKQDEVGVVLFGTQETSNDLTKEVGGYEHITVVREIKVIDDDLSDAVQNLPRGNASSDFLDAIVVGMDMLLKKYGQTNKGKQHMCLITNAQHPVKNPYAGSKEEQVDAICAQMTSNGMKMDCIIVRGDLSASFTSSNLMAADENDHLLNRISTKAAAKVLRVESSTRLLGALRTRNMSYVTVFRGDLEISSTMKIKIWVYKKTAQEKFPTLKKYSEEAPPTDRFATHEIKTDYEYKSIEDPTKVVPPEQRIKGYRYGPQVIPISSAEWEAVKFKPDKSVKLLGFTNASNVRRYFYMKDVNIFIPEPGNEKAIIAASSLAKAMKELNKVAIVRCVWRKGQGSVVIGVLTPSISPAELISGSFFFNILPFDEDVREFQFPSFNSFPSSWLPTEDQQVAADNFVMALDLAPPDKEEKLQPEFTPNPVLERFYRFLNMKSKNPEAAVPPLDQALKPITDPDTSGDRSHESKFSKQFVLKEAVKMKKSSKRLGTERPSGSDEKIENITDDLPDVQSKNPLLSSSVMKVYNIGDLNPVEDFEAMMASKDSPDLVIRAIEKMKNYTYNLIEDSYKGNTYEKAVACLEALRKGCIIEQEPEIFNQFLHFLRKKCNETDLISFWKLLVNRNITLISKTEAADSSVDDKEAIKFLVKTESS